MQFIPLYHTTPNYKSTSLITTTGGQAMTRLANTNADILPAGEELAKTLADRGWTQAEFAEILGRPPQFVSEIISGRKEITRDSAAQIAAALGGSPEELLAQQDRYFFWRQSLN